MIGKISRLFSNDVAIDLGTANTLIFVRGEGIVLNEPSVVAVNTHSRKVHAVGREAKLMLGRTHPDIEAIRPMKDGVIADFDVVEIMLRQFIEKAKKRQTFIRPRIIICVPSGITEVEKRAVRDSAEHAGAREVYLVSEPIAAAIGVGLPVDKPAGNMVVDIGGGTSEIAVIALNGIVTDSSIRVAGDEMDEAIVNFIRRKYNLMIGQQTAEQIKTQVGNAHPSVKTLAMEVKGLHQGDGLPRTLRITSDEIRDSLEEPLASIVGALKAALEQTPPELAADIVDRGIVLTGGGSLLKGIEERFKDETNLPVNLVDDPLTCVVLGAGKILDNLEEYDQVIMQGAEH